MDDILEVILSPASPKRCQKINQFLATATEDQASQLFESQIAWTRAPTLLLSLAKKFQQPSLILQIIEKSDSKSVQKKAAKSPYLYHAQGPFTSVTFLLPFLSKVSYSTRLTIINNLGSHLQNELIADEIFRAVSEHFGFFSALPILPACSYDKISSLICQGRVQLKDRSVLKILKKYPSLAVKHLKARCRRSFDPHRHGSSQKYLIHHHGNEFLDILSSYYDNAGHLSGFHRLGRSGTAKLIKASADAVEVVSKYGAILKMSSIRRSLSWQQYMSASAETVREHVDSTESNDIIEALEIPLKPFLRPLPTAKQQRELIGHCCESILGLKPPQAWRYLSANLVSLLDPADRNTIARNQLASGDWNQCELTHLKTDDVRVYLPHLEAFWTAMKSIDESVPHLTKRLLKEQDADHRAKLSAALVLTCAINRDSSELSKILPMLTQRARNDQSRVRTELMKVLEFSVNYLQFSQTTWDCILELLRLQQLYKELTTVSHVGVFQGFIAFCYENNRPKKDFVHFIVSIAAHEGTYSFDLDFACKPPPTCTPLTPEQQKELFKLYLDEFATAFESDDGHRYVLTDIIYNLTSQIAKWNRLHGSQYGRIHPQKYPWLVKNIVKVFAWDNVETDEADDWNEFFSDDTIIEWLFKVKSIRTLTLQDLILFQLKKNPSKLMQFSDMLVSQVLKSPCGFTQWGQAKKIKYHRFLVALKSSGFQPFVDKLVTACKKAVDERHEDQIVNAFKVLLLLVPSTALKYVPEWIPKESKIDPASTDSVEYNVKGAIARYLEYVPVSTVGLSLIKKFCVGDYLKMSLATLYTVVRKASGQTAADFLKEELQDRPVSYKKHILRLYLAVTPISGRLETLKAMWSPEKNATMRIELSIGIFALLAQTSSIEAWNLFESLVKSLTVDDLDCLSKILCNLNQLTPPEFITQGFSLCSETLERLEVSEKLQNQFIGEAREGLDQLDDEFCRQLVQQRLQNLRADEIPNLVDLTVEYLIKSEEGLGPLRSSLEHLLEYQWNDSETESARDHETTQYPARLFLWQLVERLESKAESHPNSVRAVTQVLQEILELLKTAPAEVWKTFRYELRIQLALAFLATKGETQDNQAAVQVVKNEDNQAAFKFGSSVVQALDNHVEKFGGKIVTLLSSMLKEFVTNKFYGITRQEQVCNVIQGILGAPGRSQELSHRLVFAAQLLPPESSTASPQFAKLRAYLVGQIEACEELGVKVLCDLAALYDFALVPKK